jgi:hypothetical protein
LILSTQEPPMNKKNADPSGRDLSMDDKWFFYLTLFLASFFLYHSSDLLKLVHF